MSLQLTTKQDIFRCCFCHGWWCWCCCFHVSSIVASITSYLEWAQQHAHTHTRTRTHAADKIQEGFLLPSEKWCLLYFSFIYTLEEEISFSLDSARLCLAYERVKVKPRTKYNEFYVYFNGCIQVHLCVLCVHALVHEHTHSYPLIISSDI